MLYFPWAPHTSTGLNSIYTGCAFFCYMVDSSILILASLFPSVSSHFLCAGLHIHWLLCFPFICWLVTYWWYSSFACPSSSSLITMFAFATSGSTPTASGHPPAPSAWWTLLIWVRLVPLCLRHLHWHLPCTDSSYLSLSALSASMSDCSRITRMGSASSDGTMSRNSCRICAF